MICSEYSWTVEQVLKQTKDQIDLLLKSMNKRKMLEVKLQADFHGAKMKNDYTNSTNIENTDELRKSGINVIEE